MTEIQQQTFEYVRRFIVDRGVGPTMDEIAEHFDISHVTAWERIDTLCSKGKLARTARRARSLRLPNVCPACGQEVKYGG